MRHIGEQHVIQTDDERLYVSFYGRVPRVGEAIHTEDPAGWWHVKQVRWFIGAWLTEPRATKEVTLSQARVIVEQLRGETDAGAED